MSKLSTPGRSALCIGLRRIDMNRQEQVLLEPLARFDANIRHVVSYESHRAVITDQFIQTGGQYYPVVETKTGLLFTAKQHIPLAVSISGQKLKLTNLYTGETISSPTCADCFHILDNRLYVESRSQLIEMQCAEFGSKIILSTRSSWMKKTKTKTSMSGMFYCNNLGIPHLLLPFRAGCCQQIAVKELAGKTIINGHYDNGVARIIVNEEENFSCITLFFNPSHNQYAARRENGIQHPEVDFVSLENGIVMSCTDTIELFFNDSRRTARKIIACSADVKGLRLAKHRRANPGVQW